MIDKVLEGYSATIFAYGLTGSGKTYTMGGPEHKAINGDETSGIIPRSIKDMFDKLYSLPET